MELKKPDNINQEQWDKLSETEKNDVWKEDYNYNSHITPDQVKETNNPKDLNARPLTSEKVKQWKELIETAPSGKEWDRYIAAGKKLYPELQEFSRKTDDEISKMSFEDQWAHWERYQQLSADSRKPVPPDSETAGKKVELADPCKNNFFNSVDTALDNFLKDVANNPLVGNVAALGAASVGFPIQLKQTVNKISSLSKGFISQISGNLQEKLVVFIRTGMEMMGAYFFNIITDPLKALAKATGFATDALNPVGMLFKATGCLVAKATDALVGTIEDMLIATVQNVINPAVCVAQQFVSGIANKITNVIDSLIGPFILPIEKLFAPVGLVFGLRNVLAKGVNLVNKVGNFLKCGSGNKTKCPPTSRYTIDKGLVKDIEDNAQNSLVAKAWDDANNAIAGAAEGGFNDLEKQIGKIPILGSLTEGDAAPVKCRTGQYTQCGYPKIEFFGGGGEGVSGKVILGNFMSRFDPDNLAGDIKQTASVIGVDIKTPGEGYREAPMVSISDSCDQGYGAYGRAIVDFNMNSPTYGQVTDIVIFSQGENYPIGDPEEAYVDKIIVENPGSGYDEDDTIDGDFDLVVENGQIKEVKPNNNAYRRLPQMNINTISGSGAVLRPIMSTTRRQTGVEQVIDCVTT